MDTRLHPSGLRLGAAFVLGLAMPAYAQQAAEPAPPPATEAAPAPAPAEAAPEAAAPAAAPAETAGGPEEVIVTARRVQERLQDVPISITVFNQEQIDDRNVLSGRDLATYTPSLSANARYGTENTTFAIRGFSQEARTTASVGVFFADVVAPRGGASSIATGDGAGPGSFFDLQNVQVLKGPQGTLFGRNTTGGAVLLVPKKPGGAFEGYVEGSLGDYDMHRLQGVVNLPVNDAVRLRFGADWNQRDGYLKNVSGIGPDDYGNTDYYALRASMVVDLASNLENYTIASYSRSDNNGQAFQIAECGPSTPTTIFTTLSCAQLQRQQGYGKLDVEEFAPDSRSFLRTWQVINTTTWTATDNITVRNIASYSELLNKVRADLFGSSWIVPDTINGQPTGQYAGSKIGFNTFRYAPGTSNANQSNFTEELQFQGHFDRLDWQAGLYLEHSDPIADNAVISVSRLHCDDYATLKCTDVLAEAQNSSNTLGSVSAQRYNSAYRDYGVYAQSTYRFTEKFSTTTGIRYTWDEVKSYGQNVSYVFRDANVPIGTCANPLLRSPTSPITDPSDCDDDIKAKSDAPTWLIDFDYKPIDDLLLYAKYARGYRQGNTNPLGAGGFTTYDPEKVDSYEIGSKLSWRGGMPGNFNVAVFYNDFSDQQLSQALLSTDPTKPAPPNQAIVNVGSSEIKGVEVEAAVSPLPHLNLSASYAYLDTKLKSVTVPEIPPDSPYNSYVPLTVGRELPLTPKEKLSLNADYALPVADSLGEVSVGLNYSYSSKQTASYAAFGVLDGYRLVNANLSWNSVARSPFDLGLFVTNLTDERYEQQVNDFYNTANGRFVSYLIGEPRMIGARLRYNFGS
jgi:iron complex outermembrane receptor protein